MEKKLTKYEDTM